MVGLVCFIHQYRVTNSIHSTYTPHLQYLEPETLLESSRTSAMDIFYGYGQGVKDVDNFRR